MATIQIRDIPDDVHEYFQQQAHAAGRSLQAYLRERAIEWARQRARRAAVLAELEEIMRKDGGTGLTRQQILDDLDADPALMDIVLDASVAVRALVATGADDEMLRARVHESACHAPHLIDAEVGNVMRRRAAQGSIETDSAAAALHALGSLVTDRYPHVALVRTAWRLRHNLSYYDALYVALATRLGCPLLTADARLAGSAGLPCAVELVD